jgi:hypothetical protein
MRQRGRLIFGFWDSADPIHGEVILNSICSEKGIGNSVCNDIGIGKLGCSVKRWRGSAEDSFFDFGMRQNQFAIVRA